LQAGITILQLTLNEFPLSFFHTAALVFTAMWDPIREESVKAVASDTTRKAVIDTLKRLLALVCVLLLPCLW